MTVADFFIIGAMKCGTSSLHEQLARQPGLFMCAPKEPNYFSDDDVFARGADWYAKLFADAPAGALKGDASTHYAKLPTYPHTVERLAGTAPDAKFIYVMRDPLDRLVSHYIHLWSEGATAAPIDEAVVRHSELVDYGRYAYQLTPWLDRFGASRILPVFFERMTAAPDAELQRIAAFLGAPAPVAWREDVKPSNVSAKRIRKFPFYDLIVESRAATALRRAVVPKALRNSVKARLRMRDRPALSDAARARLAAVFDEDLARLGALLGVELSCAVFRETVRAESLEWRATDGATDGGAPGAASQSSPLPRQA